MGDIRNRPKVWPAKLAPIRISQELKDAIESEAGRLDVTESDVVRDWLELGRKAAARRAAREA